MTRLRSTLTGVLLLAAAGCGAATGAEPDSARIDALAAGCGTCHQGPAALTGKDPEALAAAIRSILDGSRAHPPLSLTDTSDATLNALAKRLSAAGGS